MSRVKSLLAAMMVGLLASVSVRAQEIPAPQVTRYHKMLQRDVGVWDAEMKVFQGPGREPLVCKGEERNRALGDLWIISDFQGEMAGTRFAGHGQFGYDPLQKKFVGTWIDSMSPHLSTMEGTCDDAGQEMTMLMTTVDPSTGTKMKAKSITRYVGEDKRVFTMYMQLPGSDDWTRSMEITYQRRSE